jgi:hypothetical protein
MKTILIAALSALGLLGASVAQARDDKLMFPVKDGMAKGDTTKDRIDPSVPLYFGKQKTPAVEKSIGQWTANRKTNATNKTDKEACEIAFVSAVVSLQQRAKREGGDAIINVKSVYKNENVEHDSEYMCGAGTFSAGVALHGTVVKLKAPANKK